MIRPLLHRSLQAISIVLSDADKCTCRLYCTCQFYYLLRNITHFVHQSQVTRLKIRQTRISGTKSNDETASPLKFATRHLFVINHGERSDRERGGDKDRACFRESETDLLCDLRGASNITDYIIMYMYYVHRNGNSPGSR